MLTVRFFVLYNIFGRLVATMIPLNVYCRTSHSYYSQIVRSIRRFLNVQLHHLLVLAIPITRLTHVRAPVIYLNVIDL